VHLDRILDLFGKTFTAFFLPPSLVAKGRCGLLQRTRQVHRHHISESGMQADLPAAAGPRLNGKRPWSFSAIPVDRFRGLEARRGCAVRSCSHFRHRRPRPGIARSRRMDNQCELLRTVTPKDHQYPDRLLPIVLCISQCLFYIQHPTCRTHTYEELIASLAA